MKWSDPFVRHVAQRLAARLALNRPGKLATPGGARVCVGFSGGLDSVVLLDTLARLRSDAGIALSALHVHHGLSPHADRWAAFCTDFCAERGIAIRVERVQVDRGSPRGLEGEARSLRHAAFARQGADVVALAHHLDDQAETVLLQMLRGAGLKGAAAMPEWRELPGTAIALFRPLLDFSRQALADVARERRLAWIEDESNAATAFDRNFLRHDVLPRIEGRFPQWRESLARFARHAAASEQLLAALAHEDGVACGRPLAIAPLASLSPERQANALRAFLAANAMAMPGEARLAEMCRQLFGARAGARVRIEHDGKVLARHDSSIHVDLETSASGDVEGGEPWTRDWHREPELALGPGRGLVRFLPVQGEGIDAAQAAGEGWRFAGRAGGERIRLEPRRPTRTLKNLLQESGVPAWKRERLPLLFHGERLVWIPGIGICADYRCAPGSPGLAPEWVLTPAT